MDKNILEIGYGGHPICYAGLDSFLSAKPNGLKYHGIELPKNRMHSVEEIAILLFDTSIDMNLNGEVRKAESDRRRLNPKDIFLYRMDGEKLAFRDGIFDEVHMHYVVSQPDVSEESAFAMIRESYRVLVPGGYLIITGENIPTMFRETPALNETKESIRKAGFSRFCEESELIKAGIFSKDIDKLVKLRGRDAEYFFLTAQK